MNYLKSVLFSAGATACADGGTTRDYALFMGFATTHGYQFNNHCYLGAGVGLPLLVSLNLILPVYADFRYDVKFGKFSPYADFKIGCNLAGLGAYISPTIGYRINCGANTKTNINIGLGLTLLHNVDEHKAGVSHPYDPTNYYTYKTVTTHHFDPLFAFRVGVDF